MKKAIFLHSMFRAGSTYLFNKFRENDTTWPFYEPLHHDLVRLRYDKLDIWQFNKAIATTMSHPELRKPHFYEYKNAFNERELLPHYDLQFAYQGYANPPQHLKLYVENLTSSVEVGRLPVLQFNRTSLRLGWFKSNFPDALNIFLLRDPFDQFESYVKRGEVGSNVFLAINLLIIGFNTDLFVGLKNPPLFDESQDLAANLQLAMQKSEDYNLYEHFHFFLHIWFVSIIDASKTDTFVLNMDKMNEAESYQNEVMNYLASFDESATISFDDYAIKKYDSYSIDKGFAVFQFLRVFYSYKFMQSKSSLKVAFDYLNFSDLPILVMAFLKRAANKAGLWTKKIYAKFYLVMMTHFYPKLGNLNQYPPQRLASHQVDSKNVIQLDSLPRVSIVTPSFSQGEFIGRTIESVLSQGYPNLEYFIQDGGSDDGTVDVLKKYDNRISGWASQQDDGQSNAINLGFGNTSGEIMAWLNSDDLLLPNALNAVVDYFNRHPDVDVVYGNRLLINEQDKEIGRWILPNHDSKVLAYADFIPQETLFWRRSIWDKVGGVDESFRFAMDWDLLLKFREAGAKFAHLPRFLGAFRIHASQKTSSSINELGFEEMNLIRKNYLGEVPTNKEINRAILPYMISHVLSDIIFRVKFFLKKFK